jgi:hypothetical protein
MELFGNADGAAEGAQGFIQLDSSWGDIGLKAGNRRARILVGRRGAGKSRYLRAMERDAGRQDGDGLLVFPQRDESVWISEMRWLHRTYSENHSRIEAWRRLWGCAVYTSLASFLLNFTPPIGTSINMRDEEREFFRKVCGLHLEVANVGFPIVAVLNHFLKRYQDRSRLDSFLADPVWIELEERVLKAISVSTPIGCYVDTLDETFAASPAAATDCQVGLLLWMLRKFLDPNVSNRIHLVVTVRDTVFASLMQSEHGPRYNNSDIIKCLDWTDDAAEHFLREKADLIPQHLRASQKAKADPIAAWLGFDMVANEMRDGVKERVADLIVRHTRFLPREIIQIGNAVGRYVQGRLEQNAPIEPGEIPPIVMDEAKLLSDAALETATDHMMALDSNHDRTVVSNGFRQAVIRAINNVFIPGLREERFTRAMLVNAEAAFSHEVGGWSPTFDWRSISLGEVLWLHGLIGFEDRTGPQPVAKYFSSTKSLRSHISGELPEADHYYLHAALLGANRIVVGAKPPIVESAAPE